MTASRHDSAPGQLATSAIVSALGQPEPGGRQPPIQLPHVAGVDPPEHQILIHRDADGAVAVGLRELAEHAHLLAGQVAERNRRRSPS